MSSSSDVAGPPTSSATSMTDSAPPSVPTPLLHPKTRSTPHDPYAANFAPPEYAPTFLPVLTHRTNPDALAALTALLLPPSPASAPLAGYGGFVVTSQRAVEVLASAIEQAAASSGDKEAVRRSWAQSDKVVYVVGPATGAAVERAVAAHFPCWRVEGQDCGHGEALAEYIVVHYNVSATNDDGALPAAIKRGTVPEEEHVTRAPLLFVAGETRRDTVPARLMAAEVPAPRRVRVDEVACYGTADRPEFPTECAAALRAVRARRRRNGDEGEDLEVETANPLVWIVVFSPAHCGSVLDALGWAKGEKEKRGISEEERKKAGVRIASIGPTTREFLRAGWGFEVDVCAEKPSSEGVRKGIEDWAQRRRGEG